MVCRTMVWYGLVCSGGVGVGGKKVTSFDRFIMKSRGPGLAGFPKQQKQGKHESKSQFEMY